MEPQETRLRPAAAFHLSLRVGPRRTATDTLDLTAEMSVNERATRTLREILQNPGNDLCADCGAPGKSRHVSKSCLRGETQTLQPVRNCWEEPVKKPASVWLNFYRKPSGASCRGLQYVARTGGAEGEQCSWRLQESALGERVVARRARCTALTWGLWTSDGNSISLGPAQQWQTALQDPLCLSEFTQSLQYFDVRWWRVRR